MDRLATLRTLFCLLVLIKNSCATAPERNVVNNNLENTDASGVEALFTLSWEIDVWVRIKASQHAFQQDAEAVSSGFQGARLSLAARTAQSYFEMIKANLQAQVAEQSIQYLLITSACEFL